MDVDELFTTFIARAGLKNEHCGLKHSIVDPAENHQAIDYIVQNFGMEDEPDVQIIVPVCAECIEALHDDDWILLYCINCMESQWIYKPKSKKPELYGDGERIRWLKYCPHCYEKEKE